MSSRKYKQIKAGIRMEIVETWYFQKWDNIGGMAVFTVSPL